MNKTVYLLVLFFLVIGTRSMAQTASTSTAINYSPIESKLKKSDAALTDSTKTIKPKFWIGRAETLMDAFQVNRDVLLKGTAKTFVKIELQEPKECKTFQEKGVDFEQCSYERVSVIYKGGLLESFEETKPLYKDPIPNALTALQTAQKLDVENKFKKDLKTDFTRLKTNLSTLGGELFDKKNYDDAYNAFASIYLINTQEIMGGAVDTFSLYNAGLAAYNANKYDEAIKFMELAKNVNHAEPNIYKLLEECYCAKGDSAKGISVLEEGFKLFPNSDLIQVELINYFLTKNESEKALNYLKVAQQGDPTNISFIFAEGTLYDKLGDTEKALDTYKRCIELDPKYFDAYYNIGVDYYNKAVKLTEEASKIDVKNQKAYEEAKIVADDEFKKAVTYMEKAHEIQPTEATTMQTLKNLYMRLQMTDKYKAMNDEIQSLPQ
jgi:tetratricopeptide (TPR) repeat protein